MKTNYIATINAKGLKSGDFSHSLSRVNIITGKSFSGKTARLDAIRLALNGGTILGRSSELKSRTMDIMDLARNGHIEVEAVDDTGRRAVRRWMRGKNCNVIADEISAPEILLDPSLYLGLSDAKKIEYAFSLVNMNSEVFTDKSIIAELKNVRLEENTADTEALLTEIVELANGMNADRLANKENVQTWLGNVIKALKVRLSSAKAAAERMTQTVQGITALQADVTVRNPEAQLVAERQRLQTYRDGLAALEKKIEQVEQITHRRRQIQEEILGLQDNPKEIEQSKLDIEAIESEIARIENSVLVLPTEFAGLDESSIRSEMESLASEVQAHKSQLPNLREKRSTVAHQITSAEEEIQQAASTAQMIDHKYQFSMHLGECATCGAKPEHWAPNRSKESMEREHAQELALRIDKAKKRSDFIESAKIRMAELDGQITTAQSYDLKIEEKRLRSNQLFATLRNLDAAKSKAKTERDGILRSKRTSLTPLRTLLESLQNIGSKRAAAEARLAEQSLDGLPSVESLHVETTKAREETTTSTQKIADYEKQKAEFIRAKADETRNAQALIQHAKDKANLAVTALGIEKLEKIQSDMVAAAFETILKTVNAVAGSLIPELIQYRDGEIGRWIGSTFVRHEAFSMTEKGLTYAGISLALAKDAPLKIVMLDELGRMDSVSLYQFMARMVELVKTGVIDQFVGCLSTDSLIRFDGVNTIAI